MKSKQIARVVRQDQWALAQGLHNQKPLVIRYRTGFQDVSDLRGYPSLLHIIWVFEEPDGNGLPGEEETAALDQFEDRLLAAYEFDFHAALTAVITNDGARQWIFYTSDLEECARRLNTMPQNARRYPIELTADEDPRWTFLRDIVLGGISEAEDAA